MYTGRLFNERLKQIGFILLILFLVCLIVEELRYFLSSIMASFTLYLILRKPHRRMLQKGWSNSWATTLLMVITFLVVLLIGGVIAGLVYDKMKNFHPQIVMDSIQHIRDEIALRWGYNIFSKEIVSQAVTSVGNFLPGLLSTTGNVIANLAMMVFILFFMLHQSVEFEKAIEEMIPLSESSVSLLKKETNNIVISNAIGIPMIIIGQGVFAGVGYWISGAGDPVIWGLATGLFGLIPVVGTAGIWLPLTVNLLIGGSIWQGIFLGLWGACIISSVDNVIRMVFLKKHANIHPLIALLGVILGINLFGFWGVIFGPLLLAGTLLLLRIFKSEFLRI